MCKTVFRLFVLTILCALLVYAPELYTAVSSPYLSTQTKRILFRVALCTEGSAVSDVFYDTLPIYMEQYPEVHIRVTRIDSHMLFSLPNPQPDLFIFPADHTYPPGFFLSASSDKHTLSSLRLPSDPDKVFYCGIYRLSHHPDTAANLITLLQTAFTAYPLPE